MLQNMLEWFKEEENKFFALHALALFVLTLAVEHFLPSWTTFSYPAIILLTVSNFMWNYPLGAIKSHGLFSQFVIELRVLWLVLLGVAAGYFAFSIFESNLNHLLAAAALAVGLAALFASHARMQENLVRERGFK